jgi:hypothetical protein
MRITIKISRPASISACKISSERKTLAPWPKRAAAGRQSVAEALLSVADAIKGTFPAVQRFALKNFRFGPLPAPVYVLGECSKLRFEKNWARFGRFCAILGREADSTTLMSASSGKLSRCGAQTTRKKVGIQGREICEKFARREIARCFSISPQLARCSKLRFEGFTKARPNAAAHPQHLLRLFCGLFASPSPAQAASTAFNAGGGLAFGQSLRPASQHHCAREIAPDARGIFPRAAGARFSCAGGAFLGIRCRARLQLTQKGHFIGGNRPATSKRPLIATPLRGFAPLSRSDHFHCPTRSQQFNTSCWRPVGPNIRY